MNFQLPLLKYSKISIYVDLVIVCESYLQNKTNKKEQTCFIILKFYNNNYTDFLTKVISSNSKYKKYISQ